MEAIVMLNQYKQDSHCSYCGTRFAEQAIWPRKCFVCQNDSYKNPIPIVVMIVPVYKGAYFVAKESRYLVQLRNIEPKKGKWALTSGYVDHMETWQQAAVREMQEEMGIITKAEDYKLFDITNSPQGNMLIFCSHHGIYEDDIHFTPNDEVLDYKSVSGPNDVDLCFPSHTDMFKKYFAKMYSDQLNDMREGN